jgi:hypothetical protein
MSGLGSISAPPCSRYTHRPSIWQIPHYQLPTLPANQLPDSRVFARLSISSGTRFLHYNNERHRCRSIPSSVDDLRRSSRLVFTPPASVCTKYVHVTRINSVIPRPFASLKCAEGAATTLPYLCVYEYAARLPRVPPRGRFRSVNSR